MQIIKDSDVVRLLDYRSVVSTLERAFSDLAKGRAAIHARQRTDCGGHKLSTMGAIWDSESIAGVKVYPTVNGQFSFAVLLFDLSTNTPIALVDGNELTRFRTSAMTVGRSDLTDTDLRKILGAFLFTGDDVDKPAGVLSGGEKTRLALATLVTGAANVLLLDEPTNNLDPASREEILGALAGYSGAVVLVSHDEGAVEALNPERVLILPEGTEDHWNPDYADLISIS